MHFESHVFFKLCTKLKSAFHWKQRRQREHNKQKKSLCFHFHQPLNFNVFIATLMIGIGVRTSDVSKNATHHWMPSASQIKANILLCFAVFFPSVPKCCWRNSTITIWIEHFKFALKCVQNEHKKKSRNERIGISSTNEFANEKKSRLNARASKRIENWILWMLPMTKVRQAWVNGVVWCMLIKCYRSPYPNCVFATVKRCGDREKEMEKMITFGYVFTFVVKHLVEHIDKKTCRKLF